MPIFTFKSPEGKTYEITGPEGSTEAQAFQILQEQLKQKGSAQLADKPAEPAAEPSWFDKAKALFTGEKATATKDPGAIQDIIQSAPSSLARASAGLVGAAQEGAKSEPHYALLNTAARLVDSKVKKALGMQPISGPDVNVGDVSLSGLKQIMGSAYQDPKTSVGRVADFALQNVLFGAKNPKDLANLPKTMRSLVAGTAAGAAGELVPNDYPRLKAAAQMVGGFTPSLVETALKSPDRATQNAAKMIKQAMQGKTEEEWKQADTLFQKAKDVGVSLMGPEAFKGGSQVQQLASDVAASPAGGAKVREFTGNRADQVQASVKQHLDRLGKDVGGQEAANQVQEAADKVISNAQEFRTKAASPDYQYQRVSDSEALSLMDQIKSTQQKLKAGEAWKNDAVQQAGRWYQFSHQMGMKANELAQKIKDWAGDSKVAELMQRAKEGKDATYDAVKAAKERQGYIDQWRHEMEQHSDSLAAKNLPAIQSKVDAFLTQLDHDIRLKNPETTEGKILQSYRNEIAPGGKALVLPSQLESVYKSNRDKLDLNLQPSAIEKTTAGVLKPYVKQLDGLIQEISPAIKQGRKIYEEMSRDLVDPLFKGPIGKLAGKGADAQREASYARMISEMQGKTATPKRIAEIADRFKDVDKEAFPNMTRAYLEDQLNTSLTDLQGRRNPSAGANFRNAIAGTPKDRENLRVMIEKTAEAQGQNSKKVYQGFQNLLDVLDATGRVPGMGSQTQSRMENAAMARSNPVSGAVEAVSTRPTHRIAKWLDDVMYKKTYGKLAEVFTSPDSIKEMKKLAEMKPNSPEAQQLVSVMLTSAASGSYKDKGDKD